MAKILLVDDDPAVRMALGRQLRGAGFEVCTAGDGLEALTVFKKEGADLVILDVRMPGQDGFAVCQDLKQKVSVPVVFLTGAQDEIIQQHMSSMVEAVGGVFFLSKPFDTRLLINLVRDTLAAHQQSAT